MNLQHASRASRRCDGLPWEGLFGRMRGDCAGELLNAWRLCLEIVLHSGGGNQVGFLYRTLSLRCHRRSRESESGYVAGHFLGVGVAKGHTK